MTYRCALGARNPCVNEWGINIEIAKHDAIVNANGPKAIGLGKLNPSQSPYHHHRVQSLNQRSSTRVAVSVSKVYRRDTILITPSVLWPKPSKDGT